MSIISSEETEVAAAEDALLAVGTEAPSRISGSLRVAIGSSFILRLASACTGLLLATYLTKVVGADANAIGLLSAVFYATELILAPIFGALSDLRGRKLFLVLGPLAGAVAVQIFPLTTILAILAIGRMIEGIAIAANVPGTLGYLADATTGTGPKAATMRGRVMGLYEISFMIGLVGGNILGGYLWGAFEENAFRLVSLIYLAAAAVLFFFVSESLPAEARQHLAAARLAVEGAVHPILALVSKRLRSYRELLHESTLRSFVPAWIAVNAVVGLWLIHIAPLLQRPGYDDQLLTGRFSPEQVGYILAGFGFVFMVGIYIWSRLYGRFRRSDMMLTALAGLFIACMALFGINNNVVPGPWGQWPLVLVLVIGLLLMSGFTPVALAYLADISETRVEHRGAVMGLYSVFLGIGQFLGGATGGLFIVGLGFNGLLIYSLILGGIAGTTVLQLRRQHGV